MLKDRQTVRKLDRRRERDLSVGVRQTDRQTDSYTDRQKIQSVETCLSMLDRQIDRQTVIQTDRKDNQSRGEICRCSSV